MNELTTAQQNLNTLRTYLDQSKKQLAMAVPKHMTPERAIRVAITAVQRTPALLECSPLSIVGGVMQAAELGLELSGVLGQAYLVPYYNNNTKQKEAQFQVGYRGLVDLAHRSGRVNSFAGRVVYAGDKFRYAYGTKPFIEHTPSGAEGEVTHVYAVLSLRNGAVDFEVMSKEQINAHRDRYSKAKSGPWITAWEEMAKKTVIRRLAKRAPLSIEVQRAAMLDEYGEAGVSQELLPPAIDVPFLPMEEPETRTDAVAAKLGATNGNGGERISEEQHLLLTDKIRETGTDVKEFMANFGVKVLAKLPADRFDDALEWLEERASMKAAQ